MRDDEPPEPLEIPLSELSPETLRAVIEEFVTRDGTDYGAIESSVEVKVAQVLAQLQAGRARLMFDPSSETTTIVVVDGR